MYLGEKFLDDRIYIYLILIAVDTLFSKVIVPIYTSTKKYCLTSVKFCKSIVDFTEIQFELCEKWDMIFSFVGILCS